MRESIVRNRRFVSGVHGDFQVMSIRRTKLLLWRRLNFGCLLKNISLILQAEDLLMKRTNRFVGSKMLTSYYK
ncbi:hypothetical protein TNIN_350901 [Trichonephila inaurata madagascariensis]|uniref:Uncharacterized protein n=1 Tax=Trichonephila inaurata madagascariensis TaxID=2747483 RepID=A0A8X6J6Z1_9ARAC|nr:hypothetical protein TNIN_350901 [Trichonephila inaurata madagascariensis]